MLAPVIEQARALIETIDSATSMPAILARGFGQEPLFLERAQEVAARAVAVRAVAVRVVVEDIVRHGQTLPSTTPVTGQVKT